MFPLRADEALLCGRMPEILRKLGMTSDAALDTKFSDALKVNKDDYSVQLLA